MAVITLAAETRIRIITRALEHLAKFKTQLQKELSSGNIAASSELQTLTRKNAEEEGKLRRKLKALKAEVAITPNAPSSDFILDAFKSEIERAAPGYSLVPADHAIDCGSLIRIHRVDFNTLHLDMVGEDNATLDDDAQALFNTIFEIVVTLPDDRGEKYFLSNPTIPSPDIKQQSRARSCEITITNE